MHLRIAEEIKQMLQESPSEWRDFGHLLGDEWSAFYFGCVAPDYQVLCGVPREATHFYIMPPDPENQAYNRMFFRYPELANGHDLPSAQAVFVAAYAAHIMLDLAWFRQIIIPFFHERLHRISSHERHLLHLILLTYLDKLAYETLPISAKSVLVGAEPDDWLPFATDEQLRQWREFLAPQFKPDGKPLTVEIYAGRLQMAPEEFTAKLDDEEWIQDNLFDQVPVFAVEKLLSEAVPESIRLVSSYLKGELA
jgi:hypothetical protein